VLRQTIEFAQYASNAFQAALLRAGITCSMSRRANCWDNAVAESFFSTLKTELVHNLIFTSKTSATSTIAEWIEVFYNAIWTPDNEGVYFAHNTNWARRAPASGRSAPCPISGLWAGHPTATLRTIS